MDIKKLIVIVFVVLAIILMVQPAEALLWPPIIGSCGLGGIWGPFGPYGPFSRCIPMPYAVPVPVPVPACGPMPYCDPLAFGGGCGIPC